jgi:type I restriction enzyme S subunit
VSDTSKNWLDVELSEVAQIIRGITYKREQSANLPGEGFLPVLRATNITGIALNFDELVYVPAENVSSVQILIAGDVVIASSSGSKEIVGKAGSFIGGSFIGSFGAFCTGLRPSASLSPAYFGYYFQTPTYRKSVSAVSAGSNINNLKTGDLASQRFPLPPAPEQIRIVEKLDELLSDLDAGVSELDLAQKKLVQYRQSLLKAAVSGALTAEWRAQHTPTETGAQLLERILSERRARWEAKQLAKFKEQGKTPPKDWKKKYPEPVQPDTADLPELPEGWIWSSLDMLGEIASGVAKGTKRDVDIEVREVPYLRVANVQRGFLELSEVKSILATERDIAELTLKAGDILFNEGGDRDKLGRGWVWRDEVADCIHQNHVFRMRPYLSEVLPELISHHGNTFGKTWFQKAGKQTTNLASINMTILRMFPVPLGPAVEQQELLSQLEVQIEQLNRQEQAVALGLKQSVAQRQNILRAAFAGQLVQQNPNDEPASVLLERIRAERAELAQQPKVRKKRTKEIAAVLNQLIDVLAEAGDWVPAQEAFRRCGVADGAPTERIEELYAELRKLDKAGRLAVEAVTDTQGRKLYDRIKLLAG